MASREYSKRLGALSDEQLQGALDRFGLGRLVSAEPLTNGLFGQNLMLETSSGAYVFRGAPHWDLDGKDDWQFQKERWFSRTVHESPGGPSVPWPYLLDESRDLFGWGFAIQPRLPGEVLQLGPGRTYTPVEVAEQSRELGAALTQLHTVTLPEAGAHNPRTAAIEPLATPYSEYVEFVIEEGLRRSLAASQYTTEADVAWARSIVEQARPALELPFTPTVVHLDFGFHNVLFEQRDGHWRLTGVVDWMTAEAGTPNATWPARSPRTAPTASAAAKRSSPPTKPSTRARPASKSASASSCSGSGCSSGTTGRPSPGTTSAQSACASGWNATWRCWPEPLAHRSPQLRRRDPHLPGRRPPRDIARRQRRIHRDLQYVRPEELAPGAVHLEG